MYFLKEPITNLNYCNNKYEEHLGGNVYGSSGRTRTYDQLINSQLLYQLSYRGISKSQLTFFLD